MNRPQQPGPAGVQVPADLVREGEWLVLTVDLPGVGPADFRISLVGNRQVQIEGTVPYRHPVPHEGLTAAERSYGSFSRTIQLPLPVEGAGAAVTFDRGILTARLPIKMQRLTLQWEGTGHAHSG